MSENTRESWERFLNPDVLRANLIVASIYIAAFVVLKGTIIGRIRDFYFVGSDEAGIITEPKYQLEVLSLNKSPVYASLQWLKQSDAISDDDILVFERVKKCRNTIAHDLTRMLTEGLPSDWPHCFNDMVSLLDKIEKWWIINVEAEKEIDEDGIIPGRIVGLRMLLDIALGSEDEAKFYFNEFIKRTGGA